MDGKHVLVKHSCIYVSVHTCCLQHTNNQITFTDLPIDKESIKENNNPVRGLHIPQMEFEKPTDLSPENIENPVVAGSSDSFSSVATTKTRKDKTTIGKSLEYWEINNQESNVAKVISRAGKAGGLYSYCYNIAEELNDEKAWIDLSKLVWKWHKIPDDEVLLNTGSGSIFQVKKKEIDQWITNDVFVRL